MRIRSALVLSTALLLINPIAQAYTVNASNFTKPRAKTLRRIAKNLSLAIAIETVYMHASFTQDQRVLLKSIPSFISSTCTQKSIIQLKDGSKLTLEHTIDALKKLEATIKALTQDPSMTEKAAFEKVLKSIGLLIEHLEKVQ